MDKIIDVIERASFDLSKFHVLELFGGDGTQTVSKYIDKVANVTVFEVNPEYIPRLEEVVGKKGSVHCFDGIKWLRSMSLAQSSPVFDLIVVDNPQGFYHGDYWECEHFDFADRLPFVMKKTCLVLWVVNADPYDQRIEKKIKPSRDEYGMTDGMVDAWHERRVAFYGREDPLSEKFLLKFYENLFELSGFPGCALAFRSMPSNIVGKSAYTYWLLVRYGGGVPAA